MKSYGGQGFTKTKKLFDIDNVGAYLTAYLADMEYSKENVKLMYEQNPFLEKIFVKEISNIDGKELSKPKKFIKGGRLYLYPPKFNLYRCSRGIKKPKKSLISYDIARKKIGLAQPTFTSALKLIDIVDSSGNVSFEKTIAYEFYNSKRVLAQN